MGFSTGMAFRTCGHCGLRRAQMRVIERSFDALTSYGDPRWYTVVVCPDCAGVTVVQHSDLRQEAVEYQSWPPPGERQLDVDHLPQDVAQFYSDARRVLEAGVPDAAAVQLRRTLEAAAAHFDVKEKVLVKSIGRLIEQGLVTKSFGEVLHHLRVIGNQGAHAGDERVDEVTARRALRFTTQLLRNLFEVPAELRLMAEPVDPAPPAQAPPTIMSGSSG